MKPGQFRFGVKTHEGVKYLAQKSRIENALGLDLKHPFKVSHAPCPHQFEVPVHDDLPKWASDPLVRAMAPGAGPGVFLFEGDDKLPEYLVAMYGPGGEENCHRLWMMSPNFLWFRTKIAATNAVPYILTGVGGADYGLIFQLTEAFNLMGRRLIIASTYKLPIMAGTQELRSHLRAPPASPEELRHVGNVLMTRNLLES